MRHPGWSPPSPGPVGVPSCSCLIGVAVSVLRCRRRRGTASTERVRDPAPPLPECRAAHCRYGWYPNDGSNRTRRRRRIVVLPWLSEFWCNTRFFNALLAFFFGNRHWEEARYQLLVQYICIMIQSINRSERERELLVSLEVCLCWYLAVCFHRRRQLNDEQKLHSSYSWCALSQSFRPSTWNFIEKIWTIYKSFLRPSKPATIFISVLYYY